MSTIPTIDVRPLDNFWFSIFFKTIAAFCWLTFFAPYPLVQTSVSNFLSFPSWVSFIREKLCEIDIVFRFVPLVSSMVTMFFATPFKVFVSCLSIARHIAVITWMHLGRRLIIDRATFKTLYFNHRAIVATI